MPTKTKCLIPIMVTLTFLIMISLSVYYLRNNIRIGLIYGWDNFPTHSTIKGCSWEKRSFQKSGISFFLQTCNGTKPIFTYSEDSEGKILINSENASRFVMRVFNTESVQNPYDIMQGWFAKLTPEQQKKCEIKTADLPINYLPNGKRLDFESPHPTLHKTRYKIDIKEEIVKEILDKYNGLPDGQEYNYLCGNVVGSPFVSSTPYFEFDDRSPKKYLFVGSLGNDGSVLIDLNSIRF